MSNHDTIYSCRRKTLSFEFSQINSFFIPESGGWGAISSDSMVKKSGSRFTGLHSVSHNSLSNENIHHTTLSEEAGSSTLIIKHATKEYQGRYLCQSNNAVGGGLSKLINIKVQG